MSSLNSEPPKKNEVVILAGGLSSRMGMDKAGMRLAGRSMLKWVRTNAKKTGFPVRVLRKDLVPRCGPIGGILTALRTTQADSVVFLPCDMPLLSPDTLSRLVRSSHDGRRPVFTESGALLGFPCLLPTGCLPALEAAVADCSFSLQDLATRLGARRIRLRRACAPELLNVNTLEDFRHAEQILAQSMNTTKSTILEVTGLGVHRGGFHILKEVDWRVREGEHWVMLGPNGSGKTSLLSALTGYLTPSEGGIALLGEVFGETDWRELRKRVGLVSSSIRQLIPESEPAVETVAGGLYAMIDFWGRVTRRDRAAAKSMLERFGCEDLMDRAWGFLSQGERQKVLIARALMADPAILILDEPCAGLDPVARHRFLGFIEFLGSSPSGPVLVLVTHHVEEITPCFNRALVLGKGRVLASGRMPIVMKSSILTQSFGAPVRLSFRKRRYRLQSVSA